MQAIHRAISRTRRPPTPKTTDQPDSAPQDSDEKLRQLPTEASEDVLKPLHGTNAKEWHDQAAGAFSH
jgi:hypothetical protein